MKIVSGICLVAALATVGFGAQGAKGMGVAMPSPAPSGYVQDRGPWDAPPPELDEVSRRGFHDGMEGARKDFDNHRQANPNNRDEFRHPPVERHDRAAYRHGFERGYRLAFDHFMHDHR
jgi:hypothetical protein